MGRSESVAADRFGYRECMGEGPEFDSPVVGRKGLKGKEVEA